MASERVGHREADTVMGAGSTQCIVMLVERMTGLLLIGKLADRTATSLSRRMLNLSKQHAGRFQSMTVDNGTQFHDYKRIEQLTGAAFYFAHPYHSWERGSNENANGLVRQYLPKGQSMAGLTQQKCNAIACKLNTRSREGDGLSNAAGMLQRILVSVAPHC